MWGWIKGEPHMLSLAALLESWIENADDSRLMISLGHLCCFKWDRMEEILWSMYQGDVVQSCHGEQMNSASIWRGPLDVTPAVLELLFSERFQIFSLGCFYSPVPTWIRDLPYLYYKQSHGILLSQGQPCTESTWISTVYSDWLSRVSSGPIFAQLRPNAGDWA